MQNVSDGSVYRHLAFDALMGFFAFCGERAGGLDVGGGDVPAGSFFEDFSRWRLARERSCGSEFSFGVRCASCRVSCERGDGVGDCSSVDCDLGEKRGVAAGEKVFGAGDTDAVGASGVSRGIRAGVNCDSKRTEQGLSGVQVTAKTLLNREKRRKARERKLRKQQCIESSDWRKRSDDVNSLDSGADKSELRLSLEKKWKAQNDLLTLKAERARAVLENNSVDDEVRRYRTKVCAATERNMVAVEKAHASLVRSGDVTFEDNERVRTVVSGASSGSISPNSSISDAEVRKLSKDYEDVKAENLKLRRALELAGMDPDVAEYYGKDRWTLENGNLPEKYQEVLEKITDGCYAIVPDFNDGPITHCRISEL